MGLVRSGAEDRCGISHVATTGSPRFLGDPSCTFALVSDPGRAPLSSHSGQGNAAPASNKTKAPAMMMSRLSRTALVPAVYASRRTLPYAMQDSLPAGC